MIKLTKNDTNNELIEMHEMKPLEVGVVVDGPELGCKYIGTIVMRTASVRTFEVMNLSAAGVDKCWSDKPKLVVQLLNNTESVTLEISNS